VGTSGATTPTLLYGTLTVAGATTLNNSVTVSGANTFSVGSGATSLGGPLTVTGGVQFNGTAVLGTNPASGDNSNNIATTWYVQDALKTSNNGWTSDGNTGMSVYTITAGTNTVRDMMSAFEQSSSASVYNYQTWTTSNALTSFTDKFLGTIDGNPLVFRVNKNRAGRMDHDLLLGQVSFGYGAAKNTWLNTSITADATTQRNYMGTKNTAFGYEALTNTNMGKENVAMGYRALQNNQSYNGMVAIGFESMSNFTSEYNSWDQNNTAANQLAYATSKDGFNTAVGYQSLKGSATITSNTGLYNTAIGYQSITGNTSGASNTALGYQTLRINTTGSNNVAIGQSALSSNSTGSNNNAIGNEALTVSYTHLRAHETN
jgi:hypothetical protein